MFGKLKKAGILGMNSRVGFYMNPNNRRADYPKVDDKALTASLAAQANLPMPPNYHVFSAFGELKKLKDILDPHNDFVIKPSRGAMGNGIIVIEKTQDSLYYKPSGSTISLTDIRYHIQNILSGMYALNGYPDKAIVQYRINLHHAFKPYVYQGIPDIRVIVYKGVPVMAMTRLPTSLSDGRANLHQGAIGVGIAIAGGYTTHAVLRDQPVDSHMDTGVALRNFEVPFWDDILSMAAGTYELTGLGYMGADITLDEHKGPLIIELNARPGLSIQIANALGLKTRLEQTDRALASKPANLSPAERVALAKEIFRPAPP